VVADKGSVTLQAAPGSSALGSVLAEVYGLANTDWLARLKTCASEECAGFSSIVPSLQIGIGARRTCAAIIRRREPIDASIANRLKP
jgi:hypothetical protein